MALPGVFAKKLADGHRNGGLLAVRVRGKRQKSLE